ncbi:MAG: FAD-dependent oxidoreductase [Gammaproteobacteria bacterium]|nr:FAD-dependent oxidoreductase [Gammaproteobacteria bacterium]
MTKRQDLVVIGGGPGGLVVASVAAQAGLKVTLIEKSSLLGGDCLHSGCVPSKALIHMARIAHAARMGAAEGLLSTMPDIDFGKAIDHVNRVRETIQVHDDPERFRSYGCDVRFGGAQFISKHEVAVNGETITGKRFVIATGSMPSIPPVPLLEQAGFDTNESIFRRRSLPDHLAVIGGGPIGVELAQAFARFGSRVTIIEMADRLLVNEDEVISQHLQAVLEKEGIQVITGVQVAGIHREGDARQLKLSNHMTVDCDRILVATGRIPVVQGLGLEEAGIEYTRKGITVDRRLRTTQKHIYAVGDVCGHYQFTHTAEYQAGIVLANVMFRVPAKTDYRVIPRVVYSDPEVASVGITESQAQAQGIKYHVTEFPMADIDRAITDDALSGIIRILVSKGRILGASLIGAHAGELVHELALAMQVNAKVKTISRLVHAYPTYAQIHRRAINKSYAGLLQSKRVRLLVWLLNRLLP